MKEFLKRTLPASLWEVCRSAARQNWFFGLVFTLTSRFYWVGSLKFAYPKKLIPVSQRAAFLFRLYEASELEQVCQFIKKEDHILELGACLGVVSCATAQLLAPAQRHVVVEANPFVLPYLHKNKTRNGFGFLVLNCLIGAGPTGKLLLEENIHTSRRQEHGNAGLLLPSFSTAELNHRFGPFSGLIMDIEGAELDILERETEFLRELRVIIVEFHPHIAGEAACERAKVRLDQLGFERKTPPGNVETWVKTAGKNPS